MPYKKGGEAEKRAKERRTAKRRIERLNKDILKSDSEREKAVYRQQIENLREMISKTYERDPLTYKATGFDRDELRIARANLNRMNEASRMGTSAQSRRNFLTQQEMNNAESYDLIGPRVGEFSKEEVSIFYRATQEAWDRQDVNQARRNEAILKYYGKKDLREFVREVLALNKEAVRIAQEDYGTYDTEDALQESERDKWYPRRALAFVVTIEEYNAAQEYIKRPEIGSDYNVEQAW